MSNFSPNKIIIHCTDSGWANLATVDSWHRQRGFDEIGYHFLILNGEHYSEEEYWEKVEPAKELTVKEIEQKLGYKIKIIKE